ncbi:hypothetical protein LY78DRAFT_686955 [Colletotrichum sublineola]|uniref:Uncharacterized protein n=1 Tax=Colletotrichum sublineola TaxID=1173701 RepID=A0A066X3P0_COLSU|nr:hypothetical protein LY78DRAFT_686955 [Colletotrichum sublineola]KDN60366.1 hypothetical protein CSUB01_11932 [Colletotrichum sublineola]
MPLEEESKIRHECRPGLSLADMEVGSVHQLFRRQASRTPNLPAIEGTGGYMLTYRELDFMSDLMAAGLELRLSGVAPYPLDTGLVTTFPPFYFSWHVLRLDPGGRINSTAAATTPSTLPSLSGYNPYL